MDVPLQDCTIEEQHGVVLFLLGAEGLKPVEIHRRMLAQCGQSTVSQRKVYEWVESFKSGFEHVLLMKVALVGHQHRAAVKLLLRKKYRTQLNDITNALCCKRDYVEK